MATTTLNTVIDAIKTFTTNHQQLKTFYSGSMFDFNAKTNLYPALVCDTNPAIIQRGQVTVSFNIIMLDLCNKDNTNVDEIHSDLLQIFGDFVSTMQHTGGFIMTDNATANLEPFTHQTSPTDDITAGWNSLITITFPWSASVCKIPTA